LAPLQPKLAQLQKQLQEMKASETSARPQATVRYDDTIGYWRFESNESLYQDSSGNQLTLQPVRGAAPEPLFADLRVSSFPDPLPATQADNRGAVRFAQRAAEHYLATAADARLYAETLTLECFVRFDISQTNYNRTIASVDGSWNLIHRGIDEKSFELRARLVDSTGKVRDVSTAKPMNKDVPIKLVTGDDYYVALQVSREEVVFWVVNLTKQAELHRLGFSLSLPDKPFGKLASLNKATRLRIGNSDGTARTVGVIDEVRYSRGLLKETQIAAATARTANKGLRTLNELVARQGRRVAEISHRNQAALLDVQLRQAKLAAVQLAIEADVRRYRQGESSDNLNKLRQEAARKVHQSRILEQQTILAQSELLATGNRDKQVSDAERKQATAAKNAAATQLKSLKKADPLKAALDPLSPQYPKTSTGRRAALARWLTLRENPLTARVAVNHIWMRHFGRPIVESVYDFGRGGKRPTHPQLLDWLAVELMDSRWRMKPIHRLIVTSAAYRRSSQTARQETNKTRDKDNTTWWHFERRRLEAEVIRDSLLHLSGMLDGQVGGQELDPKQESVSRRSLYFGVYPEAGGMMRFLSLFDPPDPNDCYRRTTSIVPQQALALFNSELMAQHSRALARKLTMQLAAGEVPDHTAAVSAAFEHVLARSPSAREVAVCRQFLQTQIKLYQVQSDALKQKHELRSSDHLFRRALESLVRSLLNHNDFVMVR